MGPTPEELKFRVARAFAWEDRPDLVDASGQWFDCEPARTLAIYIDQLQQRIVTAAPIKQKEALREAKAILVDRWWAARQHQERSHRDRVAGEGEGLCVSNVLIEATAWMMDFEDRLSPPNRLGVKRTPGEQSNPNRLYGIAIGERHDEDA